MKGKIIKNLIFVIKEKGKGHAGTVYKARLLKNTNYARKDEEVAIKVYNEWILAKQDQASRIDSELQASIKINSENVVKSHELLDFENHLVLIMEYLSGVTLSKWLEENKHLTFNKIVQISRQILQGLKAIHEQGLIHRDLKPDNIMINEDRVVIMDLGVIKDINASATITGNKFLGTIRYTAPEYLFDEEYDHKIDLFSFGLILYELIFNESLIKTEYWTKNIVEHYFYQYTGPNDYIKYFTEFPNRFQQNEKKFLWILLNSLLEIKKIRIGLKSLLDAIDSNVWENLNNWNLIKSQKIRYQKANLILSNFITIKEIEKNIGEIIPFYDENDKNRFGLKISDECVVSLLLGRKKLKKLPESIGELINLQNLYLVGNKIRELPKSFTNLKSLSFLNIIGISLEKLPEDFYNLSQLQTLNIDLFELKAFPSVITELPSLKDLSIWDHGELTVIPNSFIKLEKLERLSIMAEKLELPDNFGKLKSLKTLYLSGRMKKDIPKSFWELETLIELDLSIKNLNTLPKEIKSLENLRILKVNNCPLESIPNEIGVLKNLEIFEFHDTNITKLPKELLELKNLNEIYATLKSTIGSEIYDILKERGVKIKTFKLEYLF